MTRTKPKRQKRHTLDSVTATCAGCHWRSEERNALAGAAMHHDRTGHTVTVQQTTTTTYGDPGKHDEQLPLERASA